MTEIAVRPEGVTAEASARLVEWAQAAKAAHQLASAITATAFCPKEYRGKPGEATAAILAGAELGFDPMASLRTFDNIQGTAAPKAITLRAVVQSHGHKVEIVEESETHAVARYRRVDDADWKTVEWTYERANRMGLPQKNPNWKSNPQAMLVARVTAEASRRCASDAILGIPYAAEELRDDPAPTKVKAQRITAADILTPPASPVAAGEPAPLVEDPPDEGDWPATAAIPGITA